MNWTDKFIAYFNPERGVERARARVVVNKYSERSYAAATKGRRGDNWRKSNLSATAEIAKSLPILRDRSREMVRDNAYAARGMQVIQTNTVGKGIRPAITCDDQRKEDEIKARWLAWAETTDCDFDGIHNYYGLQGLVIRSVAESGEVLVRKRRASKGEGKALSVQLQVLESDFLVTDRVLSSVKADSGNTIIQGVEFNSQGKRVAYHLYETHPGNLGIDTSVTGSFKTIRVPATEIRHVFRVDRPGQVRGVPWLAAALLRLKDFDDYEQAQLIRQKLAACYMAFVKDTEISELDEEEKELLSKFEPGTIEFLPPGKDIVLANPPQINENYAEYTRIMLQAVAAGLGVSYEALTGNLKDINFSSSRMGWLEFQRNIDLWRSGIMNVQFNDPTFGWFLDAAELESLSTKGCEKTWTAPRREMIDPAKEVPALVESIGAGIKTLSEVVRENGKNPEEHFMELAKERDELDKLGLKLNTESGPKKTKLASSEEDDNSVSETTK